MALVNGEALKSALIRFLTVFGGFFAFELSKNAEPTNLHAYVVAGIAALPLALEKYIFPTGP